MGVSALCPLSPHIQRKLDPAPGLMAHLNSPDLLLFQTCSPASRAKAQGDRERTGMLGVLLECSILKDHNGGK